MNKLFFIFTFFLINSLNAFTDFSKNELNSVKSSYGDKAHKRVVLLKSIINKSSKAKDLQKLKLINTFFNTIKYKTDIKHWKVSDYWAIPFEMIGTAAGDCEDYAIAKYFSLIKSGVNSNKLRIAYVKLKRRRTKFEEAHMVLLYIHKPNSVPIVLDNVNKRLTLASKRKDLKLIYSFNASGLWKAKNKGSSQKKVGKNKLAKWKKLVNKL